MNNVNQNGRKSRAKNDRVWDELNAECKDVLQKRVREIRRQVPSVTTKEAKAKALADQGFDNHEVARFLSIHLHTLENLHHTFRKKIQAPRNSNFRELLRDKSDIVLNAAE